MEYKIDFYRIIIKHKMPASKAVVWEEICIGLGNLPEDEFMYSADDLRKIGQKLTCLNKTKGSAKTKATGRKPSLHAHWKSYDFPLVPEGGPQEERGWQQICFDEGWTTEIKKGKGLPTAPKKPSEMSKEEWDGLDAEEKEEASAVKAHLAEKSAAFDEFKKCPERVKKFTPLAEMDKEGLEMLEKIEKLKKETADSDSDSD